MARRFVYFQGAAKPPNYPLKMLFERYDGVADGYYVGGWNQEPVFVAANPGTFDNRLLLRGITATGPGPNDWLVGGWRRQPGAVFSLVFYNYTGLIFEWVAGQGFSALGGHFSSDADYNIETEDYFWARPNGQTGTITQAYDGADTYGYVLPGVLSGKRLSSRLTDPSRTLAVQNLDLSYSVFRGDSPADGTFDSSAPWLATAGGTFTRLSADLNAAIPRSDLIGLTLYERDVDFVDGRESWPNAGGNTLTITPHTLTTGGTVTTGTPFPVAYQAPDPAAYFSWDASLWVEPPPP